MSFLHVLLAVALSLRFVRAGLELARVEAGRVGVLVIVVALGLLLSSPTLSMVLARGNRTLEGASVGLLVLGKIARPSKDLVAILALLVDVHGRSILLAAGHGALSTLVGRRCAQRPLHGRNRTCVIRLAGAQRDQLAITLENELSGAAGFGHSTLETKFRGLRLLSLFGPLSPFVTNPLEASNLF
jgi:hypothetical protein